MRSLALAALMFCPAFAHADEWTGMDKAVHFVMGASLAANGYALGSITDSRAAPWILGATAGVGAGAAKELLDPEPSYRDFAWTATGTLAGLVVAWLVTRSLRGGP